MATTNLTKTTAPSHWSQTGTALTMAAADTGNNNHILAAGDCILVAHNTHGSNAYTVTITSVADPMTGRTGNVSAQSLAAGEIRIFRLTNNGWANSSGQIVVSANNAAIKFGVIQL